VNFHSCLPCVCFLTCAIRRNGPWIYLGANLPPLAFAISIVDANSLPLVCPTTTELQLRRTGPSMLRVPSAVPSACSNDKTMIRL
jgi:hypothetical protein